ncbi:MAG: hypothetical protein LAP21_02385 [Acidobacteriia bacterium]|nr:hypothetical protein [Terriglobia bacterium]
MDIVMPRTAVRFAITLSLGILAACAGPVRQRIEYNPTKHLKQQWTETRDSTGNFGAKVVYAAYHDNGQLESRGEYVNGVKSGRWQAWYESGQIKESAYYLDGQLNAGGRREPQRARL